MNELFMTEDQVLEGVSSEISKCNDSDKNQVSSFLSRLAFENGFDSIDLSYKEIQEDNMQDNIVQTRKVKNATYPEEVRRTIEEGRQREDNHILVGRFTQIGRSFCIVDNTIFIWKKENDLKSWQAQDQILAAAVSFPDYSVYEENVSALLICATISEIVIIPLDRDYAPQDIKDDILSQKVTFLTSTITTSLSKNDHSIFLGTTGGWIYGVFYQLREFNRFKPEMTVKLLTVPWIFRWVPKIWPFKSSIVEIAYDETTSYVASLNEESKLSFYSYDKEKKTLSKVGAYDSLAQEIDGENEEIVCMNAIPVSDSIDAGVRFVCFTKKGSRLFFGTNPDMFAINSSMFGTVDEIQRIARKAAPEYLRDFELMGGYYELGQSFFVYDKSVVVMKAVYKSHLAQSPVENYQILELEDFESRPVWSVYYARKRHPFVRTESKLFLHEDLWQHVVRKAPSFYIMHTEGVLKLSFDRPIENLQLLLGEKLDFNDDVRRWMDSDRHNAESSATLVAMLDLPEMREDDEKTKKVLRVLSRYSQVDMQLRENYQYQASVPCQGFLLRAARLLNLVWYSPVLVKSDEQWRVCEAFKMLPLELFQKMEKPQMSQMELLIKVAKEYLETIKSGGKDSSKTFEMERNFIGHLVTFLERAMEMLRFVHILINERPSVITTAVNELKEKSRQRLTDELVGSQKRFCALFEALRDLALVLWKYDNSIDYKMSQECPTFFFPEDRQLMEITNKIQARLDKNMCTAADPPLALLDRARELYLKYISRPFDMAVIVNLFRQLAYYSGIVDICLKKAAFLDPEQYALQWYTGNRDVEDRVKRAAFDCRYACYEYCFDLMKLPSCDTALRLMLASDDQLFHICLYHRLMTSEQIDMVLSFSTPFLVPFLKEEAPELLWKYDYVHHDYENAAIKLKELAESDQPMSLQGRITCLENARKMFRECGFSEQTREVDVRIKLATIRKHLPGEKLLDPQELYEECCKRNLWDLVLQILSCMPIDTANQDMVISRVWLNFLEQQLANETMSIAQSRIINATRGIDPQSAVINPSLVMPVLEEFRMRKNGHELWAVETMLQSDFDRSRLLDAYLKAADHPSLTPAIRSDFIYACAKLIRDGVTVPSDKREQIQKMKTWFDENSRGMRNHNAAFKLVMNM